MLHFIDYFCLNYLLTSDISISNHSQLPGVGAKAASKERVMEIRYSADIVRYKTMTNKELRDTS